MATKVFHALLFGLPVNCANCNTRIKPGRYVLVSYFEGAVTPKLYYCNQECRRFDHLNFPHNKPEVS
jgi:hypothetical protein